MEKTKDQDRVDYGKRGGKAFWRNYYDMKKENTELKKEKAELKDRLRQTTLDLDYFRVLSKCLDP